MLKKSILFCLALSLTFLTGCSGHPGAGKWASADESLNAFSRINIDFDGKAAIYPTDTTVATQNCYWQASSAEKVDIQCGNAKQEDGSTFYTFEVSSDNPDLATLTFEEQIVGRFKRLL